MPCQGLKLGMPSFPRGVQTVSADRYNDMVLLTRVLRKLAGAEEQAIQRLTATPATSVVDAPGLYPGRRDARVPPCSPSRDVA
jgi:hypothetical protein